MKKGDPISFRISPDLKAALASLAEGDRRSLSQYIEIVLEDHVNAKREEQIATVRGRGKR